LEIKDEVDYTEETGKSHWSG